jgi:hypothetical protein
MSETANIAAMAEKVSKDLFKWFKWEMLPPMDFDFKCHKNEKHQTGKKPKLTHPVDAIFKYFDPYLGKDILLNTDLKSYKSKGITPSNLRNAIYSLANTIDCAEGSPQWKQRYSFSSENYEVRAMLFIYNHDGLYDKSFLDTFQPKLNSSGKLSGGVKLSTVPLRKGHKLHIVEPLLIQYMRTIVSDMDKLHREGTFPEKSYRFFYPDLILTKPKGNTKDLPATLEAITAPFLIIKHDSIHKLCEDTHEVKERHPPGIVIYYNRHGEEPFEFVYILDTLSRLQLLGGDNIIRIRVAHHSPFQDIRSSYTQAINLFLKNWGFDDHKKKILEAIDFEIVEQTKTCFTTNDIGWRT